MPLLSLLLLAGAFYCSGGVVDMLNAAYSGFDPSNDTSPLGVFVHVSGSQTEVSSTEPYITKCKPNCLFNYVSECRVSTTLLNRANGYMQNDWAFMKAKCAALPELCNVTVGIWPGTGNSADSFYSTPGLLYAGPVPEKATKCAYAFDASSDMRPNRGCGCSINKPNCAPSNPNWPCPNGHNACTDQDPLSKLHKITASSAVVEACQCAKMGETESTDPTWQGATTATVKCLWQGPQFFHGRGQDELRRALKQQHNFVKIATDPWNEFVLDGEALNAAIAADPAHAVTAIFYPLTSACEKAHCADAAHAVQENYKKRYGVNLPIVGLDVTNGVTPFQAVPLEMEE